MHGNDTMPGIHTESASKYNINQEALRAYRLSRIREQLSLADFAGVLLYDPINVRYATDSRNALVWNLHNASRYAFIPTEGPVILFEGHGSEHLVAGIETIAEVRNAIPWYYFAVGPRCSENVRLWADEINGLVHDFGGGNRRLAVDRCDPLGSAALTELGITVCEGQGLLEHARAIKSPDEIAAVREAIFVCERGMDRMRSSVKPEVTENEIWAHLHFENIARGGEWIETRLLTSGQRTNPWLQECGNHRVRAGELLCFDTDLIGPNGYLADISRSWLVGDGRPSDEQRALYSMAREQLEHNMGLIRPGVDFRSFMEQSWKMPEDYSPNRYQMLLHGAGMCDEYPIVPYSQDWATSGYDGVFKENMVLCVESYIGRVGGRQGVKLEQQVLVKATGIEILSMFPLEDW